MNDFMILDTVRTDENCPGHRVITEHGSIEPFLDELDTWVSMPLRLVHTAGNGLCLEVGPYTLDPKDIARMRSTIASFDLATRTCTTEGN
jgi:hypothetical protein